MTISAIILIILILGFIRSGTLGYEIIAVLLLILGIITIIALQESVMIFLAKSLGIVSPLAFFGLIWNANNYSFALWLLKLQV